MNGPFDRSDLRSPGPHQILCDFHHHLRNKKKCSKHFGGFKAFVRSSLLLLIPSDDRALHLVCKLAFDFF